MTSTTTAIILITIAIFSISDAVIGNDSEKLSLLEFKSEIDDDQLGPLHSWNNSTPFCSWPGVTCSNGRVTALVLSKWQLKGRLSPHVGNLSSLRRLSLANNRLIGTIPKEIGQLSRLEVLTLQNNSLTGEIPRNLSSCSSLRVLRLFSNGLVGTIPAEIGLLEELRTLDLSRNSLTGKIPASIGNLTSLVMLSLKANGLEGNIPNSFGRLRRLKIISLGTNNFTGTVPLSLYNISRIEYFALNNNKLQGSLPDNLGLTLPNLQLLFLEHNNFSGQIPATMSNASNLVLLQIPYNSFMGKVPSFASSSNLQFLGLFSNQLGYAESGDLDFLGDLANSTNLQVLGFNDNNLGGSVPESIANMSSPVLKEMSLGRNQLSGKIPSGIGNLFSLKVLGLEENYLSGQIPRTIGNLASIETLTLQDNELSGTIPNALKNLTMLSILILEGNKIHGNIPISLGECRDLQVLSLNGNNLTGSIPSQVVSLSNLNMLDLSMNGLTGSIPAEVGKLLHLGHMDISDNEISGAIPRSLAGCTSLEFLYLQGNFLRGSIPNDLSSLMGVQVIDLSLNNLCGPVPTFFADIGGLLYLNLSFNDFEGEVPRRGVFKNLSGFSATGNTRLCGGITELNMKFCDLNVQTKPKLSRKTKLIVIVGCSVTGLILMLSLVALVLRSWKRRKPISEEEPRGSSLQRVSYGDLSKATNGFSSETLIGAGAFGSVYKGTLAEQEVLVAVKVLNLDVSRALKSFVAECETLRLLRHRNLVKLLTVCSSIDFKGNDFKALVYEFMENGNLEEWLHSNRSLNLIQRIDIAIDVARALDYLHNQGPEAIVHCDIKPSNILLDGQMVAHVGDFGLAKLLKNVYSSSSSSSSSNHSSSTGIRGTIGYIAPEYSMGSEVSTFSDTYSFGILLLEMFTGKRPTDSIFKDELNLNNFGSLASLESISKIVDPILLEEEESRGSDDRHQTVLKSLVSIVEIGVSCSSTFPRERLNISDAVAELCRVRDTLCARKMPRYRADTRQG